VLSGPEKQSIPTSFYIDCTLKGLFEMQGIHRWISDESAQDAFQRELESYRRARHVVVMAQRVRDSLVNDYRLPPDKVHCVLAGANVPDDILKKRIDDRGPLCKSECYTNDRPLRLGEVELDLATRRVTRAGWEVHLTPTEWDLTKLFVTHPDKLLTERMILEAIWGGGYGAQAHFISLCTLELDIMFE